MGRLGLWLLAVGMAAIWLVALLAGGAAAHLDALLLSALHPEERSNLVKFAWAVTWLGDWVVLVPLALLGSGYLLWTDSPLKAFAFLATVAAVRILVAIQKTWFARVRPDVDQWMMEYTFSFPSAHAANSFATYVGFAILLAGSRAAVGAALSLSALIGISRVLLGVHWPSDVIGGWALAAFATVPLWQLRWHSGNIPPGN